MPDIDKILYFDSDVFFNCDVAEFFNEDITDYDVIGHKDNTIYRRNKKHIKYLKQKFNFNGEYICSGVLLMNLVSLRNKNILDLLLSYRQFNLDYPDQDMINLAFKIKLSECFGVLSQSIFKVKECHKIIHVTDPKF
jgi:lipopolysaccharide biosynthesis glycosyltransferase